MSTTLSYGYLKPVTGDRGSQIFSDLEADIQRVNDHNHDGNNSTQIPATSIVGVTQTINGIWTSLGSGRYRQLVTAPAGISYDSYGIIFRLSTGVQFFPSVEKVSASTFYIYAGEQLVNIKAVYLA